MRRPYEEDGFETTQHQHGGKTMKLFHVRKSFATALAAALLLPAAALAAPKVELAITAEVVVTVEEEGKQVVKHIPAVDILPGETIIYTVSFANTGDEAATNVVIEDPIPEGTAYLPGSATEVGEVTFSIDGGKTFKRPSLLTYEITQPNGSKEKKVASPEEYTHLRWQIPQIPAGAKGEVNFKVIVK
jgi:uncharacterized repeat protein (TIGR01451 family)